MFLSSSWELSQVSEVSVTFRANSLKCHSLKKSIYSSFFCGGGDFNISKVYFSRRLIPSLIGSFPKCHFTNEAGQSTSPQRQWWEVDYRSFWFRRLLGGTLGSVSLLIKSGVGEEAGLSCSGAFYNFRSHPRTRHPFGSFLLCKIGSSAGCPSANVL